MMVQHTLLPEFNEEHGVFTYDLADESGIECTDAGQLSGLERTTSLRYSVCESLTLSMPGN